MQVVLEANRRLNAERAEIFGVGVAPFTAFVNADPKDSKTRSARRELHKIMRDALATGLTKNFYAGGEIYHQT